LDKVRPHGARDLASAIERKPQLAREAAAGDLRGVSRAMAEEARVRADPQLRAERFMERWRALEPGSEAGSNQAKMVRAEMIDGLRHDPALHAELERRAPELGLDRGRETPDQVLQRQIEMQRARERQQDRGIDR
jgi:hypothetical protein